MLMLVVPKYLQVKIMLYIKKYTGFKKNILRMSYPVVFF